jgi:uncharacterized protein (TIGR01244 family)
MLLATSPRMLRTSWLFLALGLLSCATTSSPQTPVALDGPESERAIPAQPAVVAIPNARNPMPGVVTGGEPSEANLEEAKRLGYQTVVSLLPEDESQTEAARATAVGLSFVSIPIRGADDLTEDAARRLGDVLSAPDSRPLILHCASGNRAGALLALHAFYVEGATKEDALALGEAAGLTSLRDAVQARLR